MSTADVRWAPAGVLYLPSTSILRRLHGMRRAAEGVILRTLPASSVRGPVAAFETLPA